MTIETPIRLTEPTLGKRLALSVSFADYDRTRALPTRPPVDALFPIDL